VLLGRLADEWRDEGQSDAFIVEMIEERIRGRWSKERLAGHLVGLRAARLALLARARAALEAEAALCARSRESGELMFRDLETFRAADPHLRASIVLALSAWEEQRRVLFPDDEVVG
jgi:hypothetical protein